MLKKYFCFSLAYLILMACGDSVAQKNSYISVDEFPKFEEISRNEIQFSPRSFVNIADGSKVNLIHSLANTSFHFYNASAFISEKKGVLVGGAGLRIRSTLDGGKTWRQIQLSRFADAFHSVAFTNEEAYAVGEGSFIVKSDSSLSNWTAFDIKSLEGLAGDTHKLYKIKFHNQLGFAMGFDTGFGISKPLILKTMDGGDNWSVLSHKGLENEIGAINDFDMVSENLLFMVTQMGNTYKSDDGGNSWLQVFAPENGNISLNSVDFKDAQSGFIGGLSGVLLFTDDGGQNWKQNTIFQDSTKLNITDIKYLSDELVTITTAQSFVDEERPTFAYLLDGNGKQKSKPFLAKQDSTLFFEGDSFNLFLLNKEQLFLVDRNNVYRLDTKNFSLEE